MAFIRNLHCRGIHGQPIIKTASANPQPVQLTPEETIIWFACTVFGDFSLALTGLSHANVALVVESPLPLVRRQRDAAQILAIPGLIDQRVWN